MNAEKLHNLSRGDRRHSAKNVADKLFVSSIPAPANSNQLPN